MHSTLATVLAAAAVLPSAMAHYNFDKLIVDGTTTEAYQYVRRMTNSNSPVTDVTSTDMRCNVGTQANAAATKTMAVKAGAQVGFTVADVIGHPGPLMVYLSKSTGDVSSYDGSGDWFKIHELGVKTFATDSQALVWETDGFKSFTFNLPTAIEDGQYLLRAEHLAVHGSSTQGGAQFYISCAQIEVSGGSGGSPSPTVKIPGVYTATDPGILFNPYYPPVTNYTIPGPDVYGGGSSGSGSSSGGGSGSGSSSGSGSGSGSSSGGNSTTTPVKTPAASEAAATPTEAAEEAPAVTSAPAAETSAPADSAPSSFVTLTRTAASSGTNATPTKAPSTGGGSSSGTAAQYGQCGGQTWNGPTACASGFTCNKVNDYYSQCL